MAKFVRVVSYPEGDPVMVAIDHVTHIIGCGGKDADEASWVAFTDGKVKKIQGDPAYLAKKLSSGDDD